MILTIKTIGFVFLYLTFKVDYFSHLQLGLLRYSDYASDQLYDLCHLLFLSSDKELIYLGLSLAPAHFSCKFTAKNVRPTFLLFNLQLK